MSSKGLIEIGGEDLLVILGVELPKAKVAPAVECGGKPPKAKPSRFTEWSNAASFTFGGYIARVNQYWCKRCGAGHELLQGVFTEEIAPNGTRRLQQLTKGAQWPMTGGHRCEVTEVEVEMCADCARGLGFDQEVVAPGTYSLVVMD